MSGTKGLGKAVAGSPPTSPGKLIPGGFPKGGLREPSVVPSSSFFLNPPGLNVGGNPPELAVPPGVGMLGTVIVAPMLIVYFWFKGCQSINCCFV